MPCSVISSKAFICNNNHFLLQHRDRDPRIFYPDHWGLFGGRVEPGETPEQALIRELEEELNWRICNYKYLFPWYPEDESIVHLFFIILNLPISNLELREGIEMKLVKMDDMKALKLAPKVELNIGKVVAMI